MTLQERMQLNRRAHDAAWAAQKALQELEKIVGTEFGLSILEIESIKQSFDAAEDMIQQTQNAPMTPARRVA